ncbi:MAG TPA: hypothetical protein VI248_16325, partial [Kineosporiaceae bacterium]
ILDGPLDQHERRSGASTAGAATLAKVWTAATASLANVLDRTTLAHLVSGQLPDHVQALARTAPGVEGRDDVDGRPG